MYLFYMSCTIFLVGLQVHVDAENGCCSYPCQNNGICMTTGHDTYTCDCTGLNFYGKHCETPFFWTKVKSWFALETDTKDYLLKHFPWFWSMISSVTLISDALMGKVVLTRSGYIDSPPTYSSDHHYITSDAYFNLSYYARTLPAVPKDCPTPMGTAGPVKLPDAELMTEQLFRRKEFIQCPAGSNALFPFFAQFFTHQFFKTDLKRGPEFQWGQHGVDCSNIYGKNKEEAMKLRTLKDGKLKTQIINGEIWSPNIKDAAVTMRYPDDVPADHKFALGHEFFGILPGLIVWSTVWLREHNNICDQLFTEHPEWDDEQIYQTARLIVIAETIKIVIEDYVQHLSGYNFQLKYKPTLLHGTELQYQNRIAVEFNHLYHWHPLMPSTFRIENQNYTVDDWLFQPGVVLKHGFKAMLMGLITSPAGRFGPRNHDPSTLPVVKNLLEHGRTLRLQSFNRYRVKFHQKPYKTFEELTGEKEISAILSDFYGGDIDAVEYFVGLATEKHRPGYGVFGQSVTEIGAPYSIFGLYANPVSSEGYWKPSTFGGDKMFERMQTMNLKKLFCDNVEGDCPDVSFKVPDYEEVRAKSEL